MGDTNPFSFKAFKSKETEDEATQQEPRRASSASPRKPSFQKKSTSIFDDEPPKPHSKSIFDSSSDEGEGNAVRKENSASAKPVGANKPMPPDISAPLPDTIFDGKPKRKTSQQGKSRSIFDDPPASNITNNEDTPAGIGDESPKLDETPQNVGDNPFSFKHFSHPPAARTDCTTSTSTEPQRGRSPGPPAVDVKVDVPLPDIADVASKSTQQAPTSEDNPFSFFQRTRGASPSPSQSQSTATAPSETLGERGNDALAKQLQEANARADTAEAKLKKMEVRKAKETKDLEDAFQVVEKSLTEARQRAVAAETELARVKAENVALMQQLEKQQQASKPDDSQSEAVRRLWESRRIRREVSTALQTTAANALKQAGAMNAAGNMLREMAERLASDSDGIHSMGFRHAAA